MSSSLPVDPAMAVQQAMQQDLVQRKRDMDALKKRLGDTATKEEKLRESCEGFEAIFLQKMWEQMRKTVPKEGYLHSKDEEMYQSLFDIELCKKMAGAGGIGLADMLYQQLSQQLENTGRTTSPSSYRNPLEIAPAGLMAPPTKEATAQAAPAKADPVLSKEHLYSPLPKQETAQNEQPAQPARNFISEALQELRVELGLAPKEPGAAVANWAASRDAETGLGGTAPQLTVEGFGVPANAARTEPVPGTDGASGRTGLETASLGGAVSENANGNDRLASSASGVAKADALAEAESGKSRKKPARLFSRDKRRTKKAETEQTEKASPVPPRGMAPKETLWPLDGEGGVVTSHFGWEDDATKGKRRWNSGVHIEAPPASPVRAVLEGTVVYAGQREGFGHTVVLEHQDGFRSYYSNLQENSLQIGDRVRHGAEFAQVAAQAASGESAENSASLYFELKKGEMAINPENAIKRIEG